MISKTFPVPKNFEKTLFQLYGKQAENWLYALDARIQQLAVQWNLSQLKPLPNLTYHYVLSGTRDHLPIVLKLGMDCDALNREAKALHAFAHFGGVQLLAAEEGALLLERVIPGHSLKSYVHDRDDEAVQIALEVVDVLHQAPFNPDAFPTLTDWLKTLDNPWELPCSWLSDARALRDRLLNNTTQPVLLHGDLHHDNILCAGNSWRVIDPKGVVGDPIFDKVGCLIREPLAEFLKQPRWEDIVKRRVQQIAACGVADPQIILEWTFVQGVMACCWCLEDGLPWDGFAAFIRLLENILSKS